MSAQLKESLTTAATALACILVALFSLSPVAWLVIRVLGGALGRWHCYWMPHVPVCVG